VVRKSGTPDLFCSITLVKVHQYYSISFTVTTINSRHVYLFPSTRADALGVNGAWGMYNTRILPIFLYGSECWAVSKTDVFRIEALDQWCLRMLLGIKWYHCVRNEDVRSMGVDPSVDRGTCPPTFWSGGDAMCRHGSESPSVQVAVDVRHYAILSRVYNRQTCCLLPTTCCYRQHVAGNKQHGLFCHSWDGIRQDLSVHRIS